MTYTIQHFKPKHLVNSITFTALNRFLKTSNQRVNRIKKRSIILFSFLTLSITTLVGCQNVDPYTGEVDPNRSLKKSGLIYSLYSTGSVGWGHKRKDSDEKTADKDKEPHVCLAEDQIEWSYLAQLERELSTQFKPNGIDVFRYGARVYIRFPGDEAYLIDSPHFNPEFYPVVHRLVSQLQSNSRTGIELVGHADSTGDPRYNQRLSELRAYNLERYLNKYGISPFRTQSIGRGELEPLVSNQTKKGRGINRRVTLILCEVIAREEEKPKRKSLF